MPQEYHQNLFEMITRYSRHVTTDALHCLELLENQFRVQFTKTAHRLAVSLRLEAHCA
jgi:hypothetical protein